MKRLVVLGGEESGCGSAVLAKVKNLDVFVSDIGTIPEEYRSRLADWDILYEEGQHTEELILSADEIVKSPGIPDSVPIVVAARSLGIPIISEIEFASRYTQAKTVCITGSNGKTTTTTLVYQMLKDAGYNVGVGGNIGESFAYSVATRNYDWYVLELSSFQLDGMFDFRADIALLMNITPDHLDRYDYKMHNYIDSKMRIIRNQGVGDSFIYCADDSTILEELNRYEISSDMLPFSVKRVFEVGGSIVGEDIVCRSDGMEMICDSASLHTKGIHNMYNAMAASLSAMSAGVDATSIINTLKRFTGVEHRLESAGVLDGVEYINDSKATNVDSVWYALESATKPVVWIAGGVDKGNDYTSLYPLVRDKVKVLICMGIDNEKLLSDFAGIAPVIKDTKDLDGAMEEARSLSVSGDVVLLSPACASFDLFKSYEDRGTQFKEWIRKNI